MLVKGTSHTGMKETRAKATMITSATSDVALSKKSLEEDDGQIEDSTVVCQ